MSRTILVTVGISLIRDNPQEKEGKQVGFENLTSSRRLRKLTALHDALMKEDRRLVRRPEYSYNVQEPRWAKARVGLVDAIQKLWHDPPEPMKDREKRYYSGAELASLERLGKGEASSFEPLQADDRVILLASDTASGRFCAWLIHDVLNQGIAGLPKVHASVEPIPGLRPDDAEGFLAEGLPESARRLFEYSRHGGQRLLITSGGYKGVLPYLSPVAQQLHIPMLYLYEESDTLLEIRPLPVSFELGIIRRHKAFSQIEPRGSKRTRRLADAGTFWDEIQKQDEDDVGKIRDLGLVEELDSGRVRLSPTGVLAWLLAEYGQTPSPPDVSERPLIQE